LPKYLKILIENGYTVVIIDQITPPPHPKRKVTGVYSSGTFIQEQNNPDSNNIISIYLEEEKQMDGSNLLAVGLSCIDLSTGKNYIHETYSIKNDDRLALDEASRFIKMYNPNEILLNVKDLTKITKNKLMMYLEIDNIKVLYNDNIRKCFKKVSYQQEFLLKVFPDNGMLSVLEYLDMEKKSYAVISYIILLDFAYNHNQNIINNIYKPQSYENSKHLILGNNAILQLNILKNDTLETKNKRYQCLFDVVNQTTTAIGRRYLKEILLSPIVCPKILEKRYDLIENIMKNNIYVEIEELLTGIMDIERLQIKLSLKMLHPTEFYNLHHSYQAILQLIKYVNNNKKINNLLPKNTDICNFHKFNSDYLNVFNLDEMNKYLLNDITGSFLKEGYSKDIDDIQEEINDCLSFMENLRNNLENFVKDKHITKKLSKPDANKIHLNSNERDGYHFNLTKLRAKALEKELEKVKYLQVGKSKILVKDLQFKELAKGNTKIFLDEMNTKSEKVTILKEKMRNIVKNEYIKLLEKFYEEYGYLFKILSDFIAEIDFLKSGAKTAILFNYCKPKIKLSKDKGFIQCKNLRHPIVERIQSEVEYVPNDITLGTSVKLDTNLIIDSEQENNLNNLDGMILYGLNSSGKTVLMKAVGLSLILAQSGLYVPCKEYEFSPYSSLFARITGNDNIFKGLSSFALEMTELRAILKRAGKKTLVIGDEICRGTEQTSGNSIVAASIIKLAQSESSFIFASHLHDIQKIKKIQNLHNVKSFHLKVNYDSETDCLIFNRKLHPGSGPSVYGLTVAKYLIHDNEFIQLAESIKKEIMNEPNTLVSDKISSYNSEIYVNECKICKKTEEYKGLLDTHHINFQKDCVEGFVKNKEYIGKNFNCNLVVLCKDCHKMVHNDCIKIWGYEDTSNGKILKYEFIDHTDSSDSSNSSDKQSKEKKYGIKTIGIINKLKNKENITRSKAKTILSEKHDISISMSTISKIWNNKY
jgi:DNA mismatch repair protein MutS